MLEQDRYQYNKGLYITGMLCMLICISLLLFSFYCLPYLLWSLDYSVPAFVTFRQFRLTYLYNISDSMAGFLVFLILFIPSIIAGIIANLISNHIDRALLIEKTTARAASTKTANQTNTSTRMQSATFLSTVLIIMLIVLVILFAIEWLISVPEPINR